MHSKAVRRTLIVARALIPCAISLAFVVIFLVTGCNSITGADGFVIDTDDDDESGDGGSSAVGAGSGAVGPAGAGGATTSGPGAATSGATSTSTASGTTGPSGSTGSGGCTLPTGPFGAMLGSTISPALTWQGYVDGASQAGTVAIADYFDCDGTKGVNAILIDQSATWCGPCQDEASDITSHEGSWQSKGIKVITLMIEDANANPASLATATQWKQSFGMATAVVADPNFSFSGNMNGTIGLPLQLVVDPRTFKVVDRQEGYSGYYGTLESLAAQNAN